MMAMCRGVATKFGRGGGVRRPNRPAPFLNFSFFSGFRPLYFEEKVENFSSCREITPKYYNFGGRPPPMYDRGNVSTVQGRESRGQSGADTEFLPGEGAQ